MIYFSTSYLRLLQRLQDCVKTKFLITHSLALLPQTLHSNNLTFSLSGLRSSYLKTLRKVSSPDNDEKWPYRVPQLWNIPDPKSDSACGTPTDCLDNPNCHSHPKCDPKCKGDGCAHPECRDDPRCNPEREEIDVPVFLSYYIYLIIFIMPQNNTQDEALKY